MLRFEEGLNATLLLQIVATPHVVIADEEVDLNATIRELGQLAQHAHESFGDYPAIFKPKVEDVAHQKYGVGIFGYFVQPFHETLLGATREGLIARSEMNVRGEIVHVRYVS